MAEIYREMRNAEVLLLNYRQMQKKFKHACKQVVLLNNRIADVQLRYDRAVVANLRSWRYVTRLNLASIEGVRNMFYDYACQRADELDAMQEQLQNYGVPHDMWAMEDSADEGQQEESMEHDPDSDVNLDS